MQKFWQFAHATNTHTRPNSHAHTLLHSVTWRWLEQMSERRAKILCWLKWRWMKTTTTTTIGVYYNNVSLSDSRIHKQWFRRLGHTHIYIVVPTDGSNAAAKKNLLTCASNICSHIVAAQIIISCWTLNILVVGWERIVEENDSRKVFVGRFSFSSFILISIAHSFWVCSAVPLQTQPNIYSDDDDERNNEYYGFICSNERTERRRKKKAHFDRELPHKSIKLERSRDAYARANEIEWERERERGGAEEK